MPTYEYRCGACGSRFEEFQKMSDDPVETCPECGEPEAERLMSAGAGVVFKGSGFYETDYKRAGREESGEGEGGDGSGGDGDGAGADASTEAASDSAGDGASGGASES